MAQADCRHEYGLSFGQFLIEWFPHGTKVCDHCAGRLLLSWFWRVVYVLACAVCPGTCFFLVANRVPVTSPWLVLYLVLAGVQLSFCWLITRYGRYVKNRRQNNLIP